MFSGIKLFQNQTCIKMKQAILWILKVGILILIVWAVFSLGGKMEAFLINSIERFEGRPIQLHGIILVMFVTGAHAVVAICAPLARETSINIWILYFMYMTVPTVTDYMCYRLSCGKNGWIERLLRKLLGFLKKKIGSEENNRGETFRIKRPALTAFLSKGVPYVTVPTIIIGGRSGIPYRELFPGLILGEIVWGSSLLWGLYLIGGHIQSIIHYIALVVFLLFIIKKFRKTELAKRITKMFLDTKEETT